MQSFVVVWRWQVATKDDGGNDSFLFYAFTAVEAFGGWTKLRLLGVVRRGHCRMTANVGMTVFINAVILQAKKICARRNHIIRQT